MTVLEGAALYCIVVWSLDVGVLLGRRYGNRLGSADKKYVAVTIVLGPVLVPWWVLFALLERGRK